jgi:small nuclear ribonucleoprotein (snRNP)-like protein
MRRMLRATLEAQLKKMVGKPVIVETSDSARFSGTLVAFDPVSLSLILTDVQKEGEKRYFQVVLTGNSVKAIFIPKSFIDLRKLAERLEHIFGKVVNYNEEAGVIIVLDKVRVDETGVIEGTGIIADKVKKVYEDFVKESEIAP